MTSAVLLPVPLLCLALVVALLIDHFLGESFTRLHPVVWMGHFRHRASRYLQPHSRQTLGSAPDDMAFWLGAL